MKTAGPSELTGPVRLPFGHDLPPYRPAQKWLKDRKGRALTFDDVKHDQRILKILTETDRITQTITMTLERATAK